MHMKKPAVFIFIIIIIAIGVYLNRAYARIYNEIDRAALKSPDIKRTYLIGNAMTTTEQIIYAALGDSLTAGVGADKYEQSFPYQLAQKIQHDQKQIKLLNWSVPGAKTEDVIDTQLNQAIAADPDIITVLIGVNDIHGQVAAAQFQQNYETILDRLARQTRARIYAINIPYIGAETLLLPPYSYYYDFQTKQHNEIIKNLCDRHQVEYIDLYAPTAEIFRRAGPHYSGDLFHPSAEGYSLWAQIIYDDINR